MPWRGYRRDSVSSWSSGAVLHFFLVGGTEPQPVRTNKRNGGRMNKGRILRMPRCHSGPRTAWTPSLPSPVNPNVVWDAVHGVRCGGTPEAPGKGMFTVHG